MKEKLIKLKDYLHYYKWILKGSKIPPNSVFKRKRIILYAKKYKCETFIEGGTYNGKTVLFVHKYFKIVFSSEIFKPLYEVSISKTKGIENINLYNCLNQNMLIDIKSKVIGRCLFWLDAHYSGNGTGKGDTDCPIIQELDIIKTYHRNDNVILIDDAREFKGLNDYPALYVVLKKLYEINPNYTIEIKDDCIIACPPNEL